MKPVLISTLVVVLTALSTVPALARDTAHMFSVQEALEANEAKDKLGDQVKFYFGDQSYPSVERAISEVTANRKTNAFGKSDLKACQWVFLSSMLALRDAAVDRGANAVVNIQSYYDKNPVSDRENYECHAGNVVAGVVLRGELVKLK